MPPQSAGPFTDSRKSTKTHPESTKAQKSFDPYSLSISLTDESWIEAFFFNPLKEAP